VKTWRPKFTVEGEARARALFPRTWTVSEKTRAQSRRAVCIRGIPSYSYL
jgi:hypothetical protein